MLNSVSGPSTQLPGTGQNAPTRDTTPRVPDNLNFNDAEAVEHVHQRLTEAPALVRFCDRVFDGQDPTGVRRAVGTLMLYHCAAERHQNRLAIPGNYFGAMEMLAARLSPTGKDELRQTLDASTGSNDFSDYLAADRFRLAGQVWLAQGDADHASEAFALAAHAWATAAKAFLLANDAELAAQMYVKAAEAQTREGGYRQVAELYQSAAATCATAGLQAWAAELFTAAAVACMVAPQSEEVHPDEVQAAWLSAADAWREATCANPQGLSGAHAWYKAADACMQAGQPGMAADDYLQAANLYGHMGQPEAQARAALAAAGARRQAGQPELAAAAFKVATQAFTQMGQHESAAHAYMQLADLYTQLGANYRMRALEAWQNAAGAYARAELHARAAHAHLKAAYIYESFANVRLQAGTPDLAAINWREAAAAWKRAAASHLAAGQHKEAETASCKAAEAEQRHADAADLWLANALVEAKGYTHLAWHEEAAAAWSEVATSYALVGRHGPAAAAWRKAAEARLAAGQHEEADKAIEKAYEHEDLSVGSA